MDKPKGPLKTKQRFLALALVWGFLMIGVPGSIRPVHASAYIFEIIDVSYGTVGGYNVVKASLLNYWPWSQDLLVFAIWKNLDGQTVAVTTGSLSLGPHATGTTFAPLVPGALVSGYYIVGVFAVTTSNNPVTLVTTFSVII